MRWIFSIHVILLAALALWSTQPPTKMNTRNLPGGKKRPARRADNLAAFYEPNVWKMWEPQHLATLRDTAACTEIALSLPICQYVKSLLQNPISWATKVSFYSEFPSVKQVAYHANQSGRVMLGRGPWQVLSTGSVGSGARISHHSMQSVCLLWDFQLATFIHVLQWLKTGFGLVIGFIDHLQDVTTNNYNTVTDSLTTKHSTLICSVYLHQPSRIYSTGTTKFSLNYTFAISMYVTPHTVF
jgi:hypothetical protein